MEPLVLYSGCATARHRLLDGIAAADSITVNPQKLLGIAKTSSLLLVRDQTALQETFHTGLPYMEPALTGVHGGELGLQGSRPAEILKLWLGLRQLGEDGIASVLQQALARRHRLESRLDTSRLEIISGPLHLLACTPCGADAERSARWSASCASDFSISRSWCRVLCITVVTTSKLCWATPHV